MMLHGRNLTQLWSFKAKGTIRDITVSRGPSYIAAGGDDHILYLFNTTGALQWSFDAGGIINSVKMIADGSKISVGSNSEKVIVFDNQKHLLLYRVVDGAVRETAFSNDGRYLVAVTVWGKVYFFDLEESQQPTQQQTNDQTTPTHTYDQRPEDTYTPTQHPTTLESGIQSDSIIPVESRTAGNNNETEYGLISVWFLFSLVGMIAGALFLILLIPKYFSSKKR